MLLQSFLALTNYRRQQYHRILMNIVTCSDSQWCPTPPNRLVDARFMDASKQLFEIGFQFFGSCGIVNDPAVIGVDRLKFGIIHC